MRDCEKTKNKRAFSISEAAEYACVSRGTLHTWVVSGMLTYENLPGRGDGSHKFRRIRKSDLDAFLDKHCQSPRDARRQVAPRCEIVLSERGAS